MSFVPVRVYNYNVDTEEHELHARKIQDNFDLISEELSSISRRFNQFTSETNPNSGASPPDDDNSAYLRHDGTIPLSGNWAVGGFNISGVSILSVIDGPVFGTTTVFPQLYHVFIGDCDIYNNPSGTFLDNNGKRLSLDGKMSIKAPSHSDAFVVYDGVYTYFNINAFVGSESIDIGTPIDGFVLRMLGIIQTTIPTNNANAFYLSDGTSAYLNVNTTPSSEEIELGNATTNPLYTFLGTGSAIFGGDIDATGEVSGSALSVPSGFYTGASTIIPDNHQVKIGNTFIMKANGTDFRLDNYLGEMTFVGQIINDIPNNLSNSFSIASTSGTFLNINTNSGSEVITFGDGTVNPDYSFVGSGAFDVYPNSTFHDEVDFLENIAYFGAAAVSGTASSFEINVTSYLLSLIGKLDVVIPTATDAAKIGPSGDPYFQIDTTNTQIFLKKLTYIGGASNRTKFESDGTMVAEGTATCFRDEYSSLIGSKLESPASAIEYNIAEGSVSFKTTCDLNDYVVNVPQLNHDRLLGSAVKVHVHWWQTSSSVPNWLAQYRWQKQGEAKTTAWTSVARTTNAFTYTSGTLNQITGFGTITVPSGDGISDILQIRLLRDIANDSTLFSGTDPIAATVDATSYDCHIEVDMLGSHQEYVK